MTATAEEKIVQYLSEANATEKGLERTLEVHIAMTPSGSYRTLLNRHLGETKAHSTRIERRLRELGKSRGAIDAGIALVQGTVSQIMAVGKAPFDMVRGSSGEEKLLKNAKDECATEALEIATYDALERLARTTGDEQTAELAARNRADEERMLLKLRAEIETLTDSVVSAEINGKSSYDIKKTGAAETIKKTQRSAKKTVRSASKSARSAAGSTAKQARRIPGATVAEGVARGAVASESDLPIPKYDSLTADEVTSKLTELTQMQLAQVATYEARNQGRDTVLNRIGSLQDSEPLPGYDEMTAEQINKALSRTNPQRRKSVREYERRHKGRTTVVQATK